MLRKPAVPWVAIAAAWLAGPPLTFLSAGIGQLAGSAGQRALPANWTFLAPAFAFALLVTALLLGSRRAREHYRG